jgi:hypothetical protein
VRKKKKIGKRGNGLEQTNKLNRDIVLFYGLIFRPSTTALTSSADRVSK